MKMMTRRASRHGWWCIALLAAAATAIADDNEPDRWLEAPHDPAALEWAREATQSTIRRLGGDPLYAGLRTELDEALQATPSEPDVTLLGSRALRFLKDAERPYGLLQWAQLLDDGTPGTWNTVLDVAALREAEGVPFELQAYDLSSACVAPDYRRCLLRLSPGGGDEVEIREFDLEAAAFVKDGFRVPRSRAFAEWMGPDLVLVEHTSGGEPLTSAGWPAQVRLWRRGEALAQARKVYAGDSRDAILTLAALGQGADRHGVIVRAITYTRFEIFFVDREGGVEKAALPELLKPMGVLAVDDHAVIVQLAAPATLEGVDYPEEALLAYSVRPDAKRRRVSAIYLPREGEFIGGRNDVAASGDRVAFVVNRELRRHVMVAQRLGEGWQATPLADVAPGQTAALAGASDGGIIVSTSGFVTPRRQELHPRDGSGPRLLAKDPELFPEDRYVTEIAHAISDDGTRVDYYLLRPRQSPWQGPQPTLMTGYGAFGISVRPGYFEYTVGGRAFMLWLSRGGSLVIPAIRGGGERGNAWHLAAIREKRQNSYDDFIAVTRHLIETGYTSPERIGVYGMSNGGLLSATLGTQRPDLFGAVVSDVPLADMLRMKYMGMGAAWHNEYGDPENPAHRVVLLGYSPVHNIRDGVAYPPFLVTISTEDNRVGPGHARKLAWRLQKAGAQVYFYEDQEGGHGVSDPLRNPELMALRMTFLIGTLMRR